MQGVSLDEAVSCLRQGELLVYPTETVYGLGVDIHNDQALKYLFNFKGRDSDKAVSILLPDVAAISRVSRGLPPRFQFLAEHFLPGPLTLVLPVQPGAVPPKLCPGGWVGLRVSAHPLARELLQKFGGPITTTSANPVGQPAAQSESQVDEYFGHRDQLAFLSGGDLAPSQGSTVVKIDGENLQFLRVGDIPAAEIEAEL